MTWQMPWLLFGLALHAMSLIHTQRSDISTVNTSRLHNSGGARTGLVTLVTGELLWGSRTQDEPWSTPLIHSSWKVAWAATDAASDAARTSFASILAERRGLFGWLG